MPSASFNMFMSFKEHISMLRRGYCKASFAFSDKTKTNERHSPFLTYWAAEKKARQEAGQRNKDQVSAHQ